MIRSLAFTLLLAGFAAAAAPAHAGPFPASGTFSHAESESELNFGRKYIGFPDEECRFAVSKRLGPTSWRITTRCDRSEGQRNVKGTAKLQKRARGWRLTVGGADMDFLP